MPHIFISYAKRDSRAHAESLYDAINAVEGFSAWMDKSLVAAESWAHQIQLEINQADLIVVLLSKDVNRPVTDTQRRSFVLNEIDYAQQLHKKILPVMVEMIPVPVQIAGVEYIDLTRNPEEGYERLLKTITGMSVTSVKIPKVPAQPKISLSRYIGGGVLLLALLLGAIFLPSLLNTLNPSASPDATEEAIATNTEDSVALVASASPESSPEPSATDTATSDANPTTEPSPSHTASPEPTASNSPSPEPSPTEAQNTAFSPLRSNTDWVVQETIIDDVPMVLVPVGCFMMGSTEELYQAAIELCETTASQADCNNVPFNREIPAEEVCIDFPFWLDKYEVSNEQFGSTGYFNDSGALPREMVDWNEAREHCEARGGRLPREDEWEFAARGPDNWVYPWGNDFIARNLIYKANSSNRTTAVDRNSAGASWVGAYNMSGNVWEMTFSMFYDYPYRRDDGRNSPDGGTALVIRGGSWGDGASIVRAAYRGQLDPDYKDSYTGFRCARDYDE